MYVFNHDCSVRLYSQTQYYWTLFSWHCFYLNVRPAQVTSVGLTWKSLYQRQTKVLKKPADRAKPRLLGVCVVPGEAHDHSGNDGDLHGADDGSDKDVVQLLATGDHVQDVEVQQLVTLGAAVGRVAPEGGNTHCHLHKPQLIPSLCFCNAGKLYHLLYLIPV